MHDEIIKQYTDKGWAIFPCLPNGKAPLTRRGFRDAQKEFDAAFGLFLPHPGANVGIATGDASGFWVLDVDVKNGAQGEQSLAELERQFGPLPDTVQARTWSGGRHILFAMPAGGMGNRTAVRPGIDVRGTGGYIVAPPSVIDGGEYAWHERLHPWAVDVVPAPDWLVNLMSNGHATAPAPDEQDDAPARKFKEGTRNDSLMRKGAALRKMGMNYETILIALKDLNRTKCDPPLADREVDTIAQSVSKHAEGERASINFSEVPLTDVWNAQRFADKHGGMVRYCDALGGWHLWDGSRWLRDDKQAIMSLAMDTVKGVFDQAQAEESKQLYKHAKASESEGRLRAMLSLAKGLHDIPLSSAQVDASGTLVTLANGTFDLDKGELLPHTKEHHITKKIDIPYTPDAQCPTWERFLDQIFCGNAETVRFVHKAIGYSLSGNISEQCLFILYGVGANGKSTFLETVARVFGDYAMATPSATLMDKQHAGIPNDIARLRGARFVNCIESDENKRLAEGVIKTLTGGDKVVARFLNKEFFEYYATFKIFLATNHKPRISGTDNGIWRRIKYIPFNMVLEPGARDKHLQEKLLAEKEGILAWAVRGYALWKSEGLGSSAEIEAATEAYRESEDIVGDYITDRCSIAPGAEVNTSELHKNLVEWCKQMGIFRVSRSKLVEYLEAKKFTKKMRSFGPQKGLLFWQGIGLKDESRITVENGENCNSTQGQSFSTHGGGWADERPF